MNYIGEIEKVKSFKELLIIRDKLDIEISKFDGSPREADYLEHEKMCKYRNMLENRISHLSSIGYSLDKIEKDGTNR